MATTVCPVNPNQHHHIITTSFSWSLVRAIPRYECRRREGEVFELIFLKLIFSFSHAERLIAYLITQLDINLGHPLRGSLLKRQKARGVKLEL